MAAEGMPFPWRGNGSTISTDLDVIWGMSVKKAASAKEMMIDKMDIKAFIVGEETYGLG